MNEPRDEESAPVQRSAACDCYAADPYWHDDMMHAFETAAELIDSEEFGGENADRQMAAYAEVAKRIRSMMKRYQTSHFAA